MPSGRDRVTEALLGLGGVRGNPVVGREDLPSPGPSWWDDVRDGMRERARRGPNAWLAEAVANTAHGGLSPGINPWFWASMGAAPGPTLGALGGLWKNRGVTAAEQTRDAASLPGDVLSGSIDPNSADGIRRAFDLAGLVTLGAGAIPARSAANELRMGIRAPHTFGAGEGMPLPMDEASRIARAQALGFRPNMPIQYSTVPADEAVSQAAISLDGKIFTGQDHFAAIEAAARDLGLPIDSVVDRLGSSIDAGEIADGFVTTAGRYVGRREASEIANRQSQMRGGPGALFERGLASEAVNPSSGRATSQTRIGATAPGLPGGQGVWGRLLAADDVQRANALWHRASRPGVVDAQGLKDFEIQATLLNAWEEGHDAVMLRNYSTGSGDPVNVIVVKDPSQLRSPDAAFDPARKSDTDILAVGGSPLASGIAGALMAAPQEPAPNEASRDALIRALMSPEPVSQWGAATPPRPDNFTRLMALGLAT